MTIDVAGTGQQSQVRSRFFIQPSPVALPGSCGLCGKHEHAKGFIYTSLDFEYYGNLIFCYDCFCDMARQFGLISAEDAESIADQRDTLRIQNTQLSAQVAELKEAVDALRRFESVLRDSATTDNLATDSSVSKTSTEEVNTAGPVNSGSIKQGNVEGPDDVSSIAERLGIKLD